MTPRTQAELRAIVLDKSRSMDEAMAALDEMVARGFVSPGWPDRLLKAIAEPSAEELRWQLTLAKSALENYGRHHPWCASLTAPLAPCDCGFVEAIAAAVPAPGADQP